MSASVAHSGIPSTQKFDAWVLSVMDADTAEPIPSRTEPFTRLGRSMLTGRAGILDRYGIPWRIDPRKKEKK